LVRFEHVGLRYEDGPDVLHDVSFVLEPGSFHFLTGPSGAGKTSLLKLIYLAQRPTRGKIVMFERDVTALRRRELPALRRRIGVVFQDFRLLNHLTALENVALPLRIAGARRQQIEANVSELLAWVGLAGQLNAKPPTLSDGEKQRVAIARAVIGRPRILLADEPTGNIDLDQALRVLRLFEELNKIGTTVVIATHDRSLITSFRRPELRLHEGRLTVHQPPRPQPTDDMARAHGARRA
jgi:cell division transport system ATP-binding protein